MSRTVPDRRDPQPPARRGDGVAGGIRHAAYGALMGAADTVPGVSGGTVAFVCGIYPRLIDALRDGARALGHVAKGRFRQGWTELRGVDWALLVPLLAGIIVAIFSLASVMERGLEEHPVRLSGLFLGLVVGSVVVSVRQIRRPDRLGWLLIVAVALALFLVLGLRSETTGETGDPTSVPTWAYPAAAAVAICAMILPGISGAFILVMLGMYGPVLGAVNERDLLRLGIFAIGAVLGLGAFSRLLGALMDRYHDRVVAVMIGLMLGSVRVLWPWPGGTDTTTLAVPRDDVVVPVVLGVIGFVAVVVLARIANLREEPVPHPG